MKTARPGILTCVCYHEIAARPGAATAGLGITTAPEMFARHLDYFLARYNVVGLDQVLAGELPKRALLITFDDAYRSVLTNAAPQLAERGLPAVMFANSRPIREAFVPLENLLAVAAARLEIGELGKLVSEGRFEARSLSHLIGSYASRLGLDDMRAVSSCVLAKLGLSEANLHGDLGLFLEPGDLPRLLRFGIEIGNHTRSHTRCGVLGSRELDNEIVTAKAELEDMSGQPVKAFSFPWGHESDATPSALKTIRESGHHALFLVHARHNAERPADDIWHRTVMTNEPVRQLPLALEIKPRIRSLVARWRRPSAREMQMRQRG